MYFALPIQELAEVRFFKFQTWVIEGEGEREGQRFVL